MSLHFGHHRQRNQWVRDLDRYQGVRFVGWSWGRFFIGAIIGTVGKTRTQQLFDEISRLERELSLHRTEGQCKRCGVESLCLRSDGTCMSWEECDRRKAASEPRSEFCGGDVEGGSEPPTTPRSTGVGRGRVAP